MTVLLGNCVYYTSMLDKVDAALDSASVLAARIRSKAHDR